MLREGETRGVRWERGHARHDRRAKHVAFRIERLDLLARVCSTELVSGLESLEYMTGLLTDLIASSTT